MDQSKALEVVEQREVVFYDDQLTAIRTTDGQIYVSIRQMCDALGIGAQAQRQRVERHAVLSNGLKGVSNLLTPGGVQFAYVLRVDLVPLWLSGIRAKSVKEEVRSKLENFQREAARVLWEAFQRGELTAPIDIDALAAAGDELAEAYQIGRAIMTLARNQIELRQQQQLNTRQLAELDKRIESLETAVSAPVRVISSNQAMQLSQAVKAVAMAMSKETRSNAYGGVYGELYRRYGITSYKSLPASQYDNAMAFLAEWLAQFESDTF